MKWESIQTDWQSAGTTVAQTALKQMVQSVKARDRGLHQTVRRRDLIETVVALPMVPIFGFAAWSAVGKGLWLSAFAALLLVACCLYIPWRLRQARKLQPDPQTSTDMLAYLQAERAAARAQYDLLKGILGWYLGPIGVGVILFYFGANGWSMATLYYTLFVLGIYLIIYLLNQMAATGKIAPQIKQIDTQIRELKQGEIQ